MRYKISIGIILLTVLACTAKNKSDQPVTLFYPNGAKKAEGMNGPNGKEGLWIEWDKVGHKISETRFLNGLPEGTWLRFYLDGTLADHTEYRAGLKNGISIFYYPNGKPAMETHFSAGKPVGVWTNWDTNGIITRRVDIDSGTAVK